MPTPNPRNFLNLLSLAGQTDGTDNGTLVELAAADHGAGLTFGVRATLNSGTGTNDVEIQDSMDGVNWDTLTAATQLTATGQENVALSRPPARFIRAVSVAAGGGGGDWDIEVDIVGAFLTGTSGLI